MRVLLIVLAASCAVAPGAAAQGLPGVPVLPPQPPSDPDPDRPPPPPPPTGPEAAAGEVVSYRANPQGNGIAPDNSVFGPLEQIWHRQLGGGVNQPLVAGGRVLVTVNACSGGIGCEGPPRLLALDPKTGADVWSQPITGTYNSAHIAANAGTVVMVNFDGLVRAFAIGDGKPLWERDLGSGSHAWFDAIPMAARGTVFLLGGARLYALSIADGSQRWMTEVRGDASAEQNVKMSLDSERVFIGDNHGRATAIAQSTGGVVWSKDEQVSSTTRFQDSLVSDGRLLVPQKAYDAATGAERATPSTTVEAAAGGLGFGHGNGGPLSAFPLDGGPARWTFKTPEQLPRNQERIEVGAIRPLIVGPTLYTPTQAGLFGLDRETGEVLSQTVLPDGGHNNHGGIVHGMAATGGALYLANQTALTAFAPVLRPEPRGADIAATEFDVVAGKKVGIVGGFGREVFEGKPEMVLEQSRTGRGKWAVVARGPSLADGTGYYDVAVDRNTLFRISGAGSSRAVTIYAYPRTAWRITQTSRTRGRIKLLMKAGRDFRPGGRTVVVYLAREKQKRYDRLGAARVRNLGRGRARAVVPFKLVRKSGRKDYLTYCIKGLKGWGRDDAFQRRCGRARMPY